jgi:transcriptional regulator with XRE-family HTH domain
MNRIKDIRRAAGLTQAGLAEKLGTSENHVWRLENGHTDLTQEWMTAIAEILNCSPADLIANVVAAETGVEVESADSSPVVAAIASRGLRVYRVLERSMANLGITPGTVITVDESDQAVRNLKPLDVVLVEVGKDRNRVLRQFVPPSMLVTNRSGANLAIDLSDSVVTPEIVGVVLHGPKAAS